MSLLEKLETSINVSVLAIGDDEQNRDSLCKNTEKISPMLAQEANAFERRAFTFSQIGWGEDLTASTPRIQISASQYLKAGLQEAIGFSKHAYLSN